MMLTSVVDGLIVYLMKHKLVPEEERDVYAYSLEVALFWLLLAALALFFGNCLMLEAFLLKEDGI